MSWGYVLLITVVFTTLLIIIQRTEDRKRKLMRGFVITMGILLMIRYELQGETLLGYMFALIMSFLFWLLIGRYNAVGSSDEIKVYGMDD